jgi:hypothetical protein
MRHALFVVVLALAAASPIGAAQDKPAKQDKQDKKAASQAGKTISLSGCVVHNEKPDHYTLEDASEGKYRLTGVALRDYLGQRVQIAGAVVESKKLVIKGGLTPNANVAAQAGAMDPARAAVESAGGIAGPGTVDLPEFNVKSVRPVSGGCPN